MSAETVADDPDGRYAPGGGFDVIVIAASAGGLAALSRVLGDLPAELPVPVVIVQHLDPRHRSLMADILRRRTPLQVEEAAEGVKLQPATVYVAHPTCTCS